jgi:hypothetical protein
LIVVLSRRDCHESAGVSSFYCLAIIIPNPPFSHSLLCFSYHGSPQNRFSVGKVTNMKGMFYHAEDFDQNLCPWGPKLTHNVLVADMFSGTSCESKYSPDLTLDPPEPLCESSCA